MELGRRKLLLLRIMCAANMIEGEARLQKIVFMLQYEREVDIGYNFKFFYFGPYSQELEEDLNSLAKEGLIREIYMPAERYTWLFVKTFRLSAEGMKAIGDGLSEVEDHVDYIRELNGMDYEELASRAIRIMEKCMMKSE